MARSTRLKRGIVIASWAVVVSIAAVACGEGGSGGGEEGSTSLRFANIYNAEHPFNASGASSVMESVQEDGSGLTVNNFPGGQLGQENELAESMASQNLDMAIIGPSFLSEYDERLSVLDAAYVFEDVDHMERVTGGEIGNEIYSGLVEDSNMRVLGTWYYGTRQLTTGDTEVNSPEDLDGVSVRAPDSEIPIANVRALGASPTPIAFEEVYLALQQGTVDGQENPIPTIAAENFNEVQDYLMMTDHVVQSTQVVVAENVWQELSSEQQSALQDAVENATPEVRESIEQSEEESLQEWRDAGQPQIIEDVDRQAFRERAQQRLPEEFGDQWGNLYERIRQEAE